MRLAALVGHEMARALKDIARIEESADSALAEGLASVRFDGLVSSDLRRAIQTATPVAARLGLTLETRKSLRELDVGRWTGKLIDETRSLLGAVLPLADHEREFLERLNGQGEIEPSLLTAEYIFALPGSTHHRYS